MFSVCTITEFVLDHSAHITLTYVDFEGNMMTESDFITPTFTIANSEQSNNASHSVHMYTI